MEIIIPDRDILGRGLGPLWSAYYVLGPRQAGANEVHKTPGIRHRTTLD